MYRTVRVSILVAAVILLAAGVMAQAPNTIQYQGKLADATGPITTAVNVTFRIYDSESGGSMLWEETHVGLIPNDIGVFTVALGSITTLGPHVFSGQPRYLGITVGADAEMTPRQLITSVPYSLNSGGFAYTYLDSYDITEAVTAPLGLGVTVTQPGYLVLEVTGWSGLDASTTEFAWCAISISADASALNNASMQYLWAEPNAGSYAGLESFSIRWVLPVAAPGNYTYYVTTQKVGTPSCEIFNSYFTATLMPTWMGTSPPPSLSSPAKLSPEILERMKPPAQTDTSEENR